MDFTRFHGANMNTDDDGTRHYSDRGPIWLRKDAVIGFYSHTILTQSNVIRVMENLKEIAQKFGVKEEAE